MIDTTLEKVFPYKEAMKRIPGRQEGTKINITTIHRWANHGVYGVKLETLSVGAIRMTSAEALQRFFEAVSEAREARRNGQLVRLEDSGRTGRQKERDSERASVKLAELGA